MKRLFLVFHGRFPSEKAASLFAAKSCESFADHGYEVTLLVPRRLGADRSDPHGFYSTHKNFRIVYLPTVDLFWLPFFLHVAFWVSLVVFSLTTFVYLLVRSGRSSVVYSNENLPLLFATYIRRNTFYEVHDMPERNYFFYKLLFRRVRGVIVTNRWKLERIADIFKLSHAKLFYEPNAVEIADFDIATTKEEARIKLGVGLRTPMVLYTGHLYGWKGVDTLARAAKILSERVSVYIIGGTVRDAERFREEFGDISNLYILGHRAHREIPLWQKAADVVVLPNTAREDISKYYTSPMKLFEYMASRRPIVATDIHSVREIVDKSSAIMVSPDDPESMARGIVEALENHELAGMVTDAAYHSVTLHTWDKRAQRILGFVEKAN